MAGKIALGYKYKNKRFVETRTKRPHPLRNNDLKHKDGKEK